MTRRGCWGRGGGGGLIHWTTGTLCSDYDWLRVPSTRFLSLDDDIGKSDGSEKICKVVRGAVVSSVFFFPSCSTCSGSRYAYAFGPLPFFLNHFLLVTSYPQRNANTVRCKLEQR